MASPVGTTRDQDRADAAHLLRRTAMSVHPRRVDELAGLDVDDAVEQILREDPDRGRPPATEDWGDTAQWWIKAMTAPDTGLTDRMAWFWHGLLTTNVYKVSDSALIAEQLEHFRADGLGNFRSLLHGFVSGGALLEYLDASWSMAANPNENLARELMELFTVGRGHYSEDDVRAAARALAGWVVEDGSVEFRRENAFIAPLIFLGEQASYDTAMIVDRLCDHPATAARVASRLWADLVGTGLDPSGSDELGRWWQGQDLEIRPLVERILTDPAFQAGRFSRPRTSLEWYCAIRAVVDLEDDSWHLENLGQMPYLPPTVAGWPRDDRWLAPGSLLARTSFVHSLDLQAHVGSAPTTEAILDRCSMFEVSDETVQALDAVATTPELPPEAVETIRWRLVFSSPEFNLS